MLWSGAWEGVHRAREKGITQQQLLYRAGYFGIVDFLREFPIDGLTRRLRALGQIPVQQFSSIDGRGAGVASKSPMPPPEHRLLQSWQEYSPMRRWIDIEYRLHAYLNLVEGWTMKEIGKYFGISESQIHNHVTKFRQGVRLWLSLNRRPD